MKKKIKKILLFGAATFLFLVLVLAVHIYFVYRPAPDAYTKVMARIDVKQSLSQADANSITSWLYHQKGVDHVLVNPDTRIVVFTFFPVKTTGNKITEDFKKHFGLKAERFMPSTENLAHSCPVAASSFTYKIYKVISKII
jgi:hypothetical protein